MVRYVIGEVDDMRLGGVKRQRVGFFKDRSGKPWMRESLRDRETLHWVFLKEVSYEVTDVCAGNEFRVLFGACKECNAPVDSHSGSS